MRRVPALEIRVDHPSGRRMALGWMASLDGGAIVRIVVLPVHLVFLKNNELEK
jgi:hypothetical protein